MNCARCRYWGKDPDADPADAEFAPVLRGHPGEERGLKACYHPKVGGGCYADASRNGPDSANAYETIATGPEFGCVHWVGEAVDDPVQAAVDAFAFALAAAKRGEPAAVARLSGLAEEMVSAAWSTARDAERMRVEFPDTRLYLGSDDAEAH